MKPLNNKNEQTFAVFLFLCFITLSVGQLPAIGKCPEPEVAQDFNPYGLLGKWYEIERTQSFFEAEHCTVVTYNETKHKDRSLHVTSTGRSGLLGWRNGIKGISRVLDKENPAKMRITINTIPIPYDYYVLHTDYKNYAIFWGCQHISFGLFAVRVENLWIISRQRSLGREDLKEIYKLIDSHPQIISRHLLRKIDQENCR